MLTEHRARSAGERARYKKVCSHEAHVVRVVSGNGRRTINKEDGVCATNCSEAEKTQTAITGREGAHQMIWEGSLTLNQRAEGSTRERGQREPCFQKRSARGPMKVKLNKWKKEAYECEEG